MKAAVLKSAGEIEIEERPIPELEEDEVLIEVKYCGICGSDVEVYKNGIYPKITLPGNTQIVEAENVVLGHEFTGRVSETGKKVDNCNEGDRVVVSPLPHCGECFWCRRGEYNLCPQTNTQGIGLSSPGAFAEYVAVKDYMVKELPENLSFKKGALTESFSTPIQAVKNSNAGVGDSIAVLGAGTIGLFTVLSLNISGVSSILVSELSQRKREIAKKIGADLAIDPEEKDIIEAGGDRVKVGFDKVFECVGSSETFNESVRIVRRGGDVILVGIPGGSVETMPVLWIPKGIKIRTVFGYDKEFDTALNFLSSNVANFDLFISDVIPLNKVEDGFDLLMEKEDKVKILVKL